MSCFRVRNSQCINYDPSVKYDIIDLQHFKNWMREWGKPVLEGHGGAHCWTHCCSIPWLACPSLHNSEYTKHSLMKSPCQTRNKYQVLASLNILHNSVLLHCQMHQTCLFWTPYSHTRTPPTTVSNTPHTWTSHSMSSGLSSTVQHQSTIKSYLRDELSGSSQRDKLHFLVISLIMSIAIRLWLIVFMLYLWYHMPGLRRSQVRGIIIDHGCLCWTSLSPLFAPLLWRLHTSYPSTTLIFTTTIALCNTSSLKLSSSWMCLAYNHPYWMKGLHFVLHGRTLSLLEKLGQWGHGWWRHSPPPFLIVVNFYVFNLIIN